MRVRASVVFVVASLAVVTIGANGAFPDGVGGVELFAKAAAMRDREGSLGTTGWHLFIVVLGHGVPPEAVVMSVFYGCGQSYSTSAHGFWSIVVGNEGAVVKVWMNA